MFIYCIGNVVNDKKYIGKTIVSPWDRFSDHMSNAKQGRKYNFYNAIRKHGKENFYMEFVIDYTGKVTEKELNEIEIQMIEEFDSYNNGYNATKGGEGNSGNGKKINLYDLEGNHIRDFDSIAEASRILNLKECNIRDSCNKAVRCTSNMIFRFDGDPVGEYISSRKKVDQYDLDGNFIKTWNSGAEVAKELKINDGNIYGCCNKRQKIAGKYIFRYHGDTPPDPITQTKRKRVDLFDLNINFIKTFDSIKDAAKELNVSTCVIELRCKSGKPLGKQYFMKFNESHCETGSRGKSIKIKITNMKTGEIEIFESMKDARLRVNTTLKKITECCRNENPNNPIPNIHKDFKIEYA
ncbi:MAG: NUMOD1 domain-containing DNA-binding protein [Magnetococcus sp. YQC-3]